LYPPPLFAIGDPSDSCYGAAFLTFLEHVQYVRIVPPSGFSTEDMYKKKKVAASKHRRRQKKLKDRRKAQAQADQQ
jgi:hypothetical protein